MAFFNQSEFHQAKRVLSTAFTAAQLKTQLRQVEQNLKEGRSDSTEGTLRQYRSLLTEVIAEKETPRAVPRGTVTMPSIEELKAKYLGKGPKQP